VEAFTHRDGLGEIPEADALNATTDEEAPRDAHRRMIASYTERGKAGGQEGGRQEFKAER